MSTPPNDDPQTPHEAATRVVNQAVHPPQVAFGRSPEGHEPVGQRPAPVGAFTLHARLDPGEHPDTGILKAWISCDNGPHEILAPTHVDIIQVCAHGWTHLEVSGEGAPELAISMHDGVLRYVRTGLLALAGLPGGSYQPPVHQRFTEDDPEESDDSDR